MCIRDSIKGAKTGLLSKAMTAPDGMVRIPLNESSDPKSQINEYLEAYNGEGIQHIACFTDNIYDTVEAMRAVGVEFLDTPDTYFDVIDQRVPNPVSYTHLDVYKRQFTFLADEIVNRDFGDWTFPLEWFQSVNSLSLIHI